MHLRCTKWSEEWLDSKRFIIIGFDLPFLWLSLTVLPQGCLMLRNLRGLLFVGVDRSTIFAPDVSTSLHNVETRWIRRQLHVNHLIFWYCALSGHCALESVSHFFAVLTTETVLAVHQCGQFACERFYCQRTTCLILRRTPVIRWKVDSPSACSLSTNDYTFHR